MRVFIGLLFIAGCKREAPAPSLSFVQRSTPVTTSCLESAELQFEGAVPSAFAGERFQFFDPEGIPIDTGSVGIDEGPFARVALRAVAPPARGPVRGRLEIAGQSVDVSLALDVRGPELPEMRAFGLWDGAEVLGATALAALAEDSPWDGAIGVDPGSLLVAGATDPQAAYGAPTAIAFEACDEAGACVPIPSQADGSFGEAGARALVFDVAAATCDALPDRRQTRLVASAENACGVATATLELRLVHDDCDGDGLLASADCDDEDAALQQVGDVTANGSPAPDLSSAIGAAQIVMCGGQHAGGFELTQNTTLRSVGAPAEILAPIAGSTIRVGVGVEATLDNLIVRAGPGSAAGPLESGGGAVNAYDALRLRLIDTELRGGPAGVGGALVGPLNGQLDATGGRWSGGTTTGDGGVALLYGGSVTGVEVRSGSAGGSGGGIASRDNPLTLVDVELAGHVATRGGGLHVERADALVSGVRFVDGSATDGGCLSATLQPGQLIELRPSIVDLEPTTLSRCTATGRGGGLHVTGGGVATLFVEVEDGLADEGGSFALEDAAWADSASRLTRASASTGAAAWLSGGVSASQGSSWEGLSGDGAWLTGGATLDLQNSSVQGFACGAWIDDGALTQSGVSGVNALGGVCGSGWAAPFGAPVCSSTGCP